MKTYNLRPSKVLAPSHRIRLLVCASLVFSFTLEARGQHCPATVRVGTSCSCHSCTGTVDVVSFETYVKRVLPQEWINCWGSQAGGMNALQAGAVAIRSYTIPRIANTMSSHGGGTYDICNNSCCQTYGTSQFTNTNNAVDNTTSYVLVTSGVIQFSEYAAEHNNHLTCGNGMKGNGTGSWPCTSDAPCAGQSFNGHGRGMCQNGSARWATGLNLVNSSCTWLSSHGYGTKTWQQILSHYYPSWILDQCTVVSPPANDNCPGTALVSSTNCNYTSGTVADATPSYGANQCSGCSCTSPDDYDVYYNFQAVATSHTVAVTNYATNFDAVIELRTACASGSGNYISCYDPVGAPSSVSYTWNNLTVGQTYYVRVFEYNYSGTPPSSPNFDICVTHVGCTGPYADAGSNKTISCGATTPIGGSPTASGGTGPYTYSWSPSAGLSCTTCANPNANPSSTASYTVTVTDANNCSDNDQMTVTVGSGPSAEAGSNQNISCGAITTIGGSPTASGGTGPYTYSWSPGAGLSCTTCANPNANPSSTTSYTVTVTDANNCSDNDQMTVTVGSGPSANAGSDQTISCGASTPLGGAPTASGGTAPYSYLWSPALSLSCTNCANPMASPLGTTTYTLTVTDANNCTGSDQVTVTIGTAPSADAGNDQNIPCNGSVSIGGSPTATGGTGPYTYSWSPTNGLSCSNCANPTAGPTGTTTYTVTVTDANNCIGTDQVSVTVNSAPTAEAGADATITAGDSVQIGGAPTASGGLGPYLYSWSPTSYLSCSNCPNPIASPVVSATYTVTVTDASSCADSDQLTLIVLGGLPVVDFYATPMTGPEDLVVDFSDSSSNNPTNWSWTFPGGLPSMSTVQHPSGIVYMDTGRYMVRLEVSNAFGTSQLVKDSFIVVTAKPGTGLDSRTIGLVFSVHPNPFTQEVIIVFGRLSFPAEVEVFNTVGQIVLKSDIETAVTRVNLEWLPAGVYQVRLGVDEEHVSRTIIKVEQP